MWILFSLLCMIALTIGDIIGKKVVSSDELAPIKLRIMFTVVSTMLGLFMYIFNLGESGLAPWILIIKYPSVVVAAISVGVSDFLYITCLKYIGMTIMEAISSFEGIVIFVGLIIINLSTGNLSAVNDLFIPSRLLLVIPIFFCTTLLPNIDLLEKKNKEINKVQKEERKHLVLGIIIALMAAIFSCGDSLVADTLLDSGVIGTIDITMAVYFPQILLLPIFCLVLLKKNKFSIYSYKKVNMNYIIYAVLYVTSLLFGSLAATANAVYSEVMYLTYPVIAILGAKIILKEKYSWKQNLCIWVITLAAIGFCLIDYI